MSAAVTFGSEGYAVEDGQSFPIGAYIHTDGGAGTYYVTINYDPAVLTYVSGADAVDAQNGVLTLSGSTGNPEIKYWLTFQAKAAGDTAISVSSASVNLPDDTGAYDVAVMGAAPVHVQGRGQEENEDAEEGEEAEEQDISVPVESSTAAGLNREEERSEQELHTPAYPPELLHIEGGGETQGFDPAGSNPTDLDASGIAVISGENHAGDSLISDEIATDNETLVETETGNAAPKTSIFFNSYVVLLLGLIAIIVAVNAVVFSIARIVRKRKERKQRKPEDEFHITYDEDSDLEFLHFDEEPDEDEEPGQGEADEASGAEAVDAQEDDASGAEAADAQTADTSGAEAANAQEDDASGAEAVDAQTADTPGAEAANAQEDEASGAEAVDAQEDDASGAEAADAQVVDTSGAEAANAQELDTSGAMDAIALTGTNREAFPSIRKLLDITNPPAVDVRDVTMMFKLSSGEVSGFKEFLIQLLKRQIRYRRLYALYHVSFSIQKGEVVGIIGTNGSGKSTLLKIISGALKPTEGEVRVDRRKLQLLTLGTGFDMELTAHENVYLNGSIIGYTREFLDAHYEEIVSFSELSGFMEEKVKNFSSGMVSRLGFAIATAGRAADILILDEVLSVGDEFFRKKSLARISEMIHGGSTVLMVSHGMDTILNHCTRALWIEKGELKMDGPPKEVCAAYREYGKNH